MHFDSNRSRQESAQTLAAYIRGQNSVMKTLYGSCNFSIRYAGQGLNKRVAWEAEMTLIAGDLNFHGQVYGFNTGIISPRDGTYLEYTRVPNQDVCTLAYKRNEKMVYTVGNRGDGGAIFKLRPGHGVVEPQIPTTGGTVYPQSRVGLHTVQQFVNFNV
jgi:hypothetical protein